MIHTNVDPDVSSSESTTHIPAGRWFWVSFFYSISSESCACKSHPNTSDTSHRSLSLFSLLPLKKSRRRMQSWQITIHFHGESLNHWMCIRAPLFLSHFFLSSFSLNPNLWCGWRGLRIAFIGDSISLSWEAILTISFLIFLSAKTLLETHLSSSCIWFPNKHSICNPHSELEPEARNRYNQ